MSVPGAEPRQAGQWLQVDPEGAAEIHLKRAVDGNGIVVHALNLTAEARTIHLTAAVAPQAAWLCSPLEENGAPLPVEGGGVELLLPPRSVTCTQLA